MTKAALLSSAARAVFLAVPAASASDLPFRKSPPASAPAPIFTWTGFYVGVNQGFGGAVLDANVNLAGPGVLNNTQTTNRANGFSVGGEAGYDYQFSNNVVLGVETDMQWSEIRASHQATTYSSAAALFGNANIGNNLNWFGTTRLRLGYSFGRLLPYVTGGVAYGEVAANGEQFVGGALFGGSATQTNVGWAAGAGLEYALSENLSARAEYIYVQIPGVNGPAAGFTPAPFPSLVGSFSTGSFGAHLIRTGLNWKFGGPGSLSPDTALSLVTDPPTLDWTGFYVGANGGYGGDRVDALVNLVSALPVATSTQTQNRNSGFMAGGQLGYNRQLSNHVVVGLETDAQWSGVKASHQASNGPGAFTLTDIGNGLDWFGTPRARLGWASGSPLTYVTGGADFERPVLRLRDPIESRLDDRRRRGICAEPKSFAESGVSLYRLRRRRRHGLWLRPRASFALRRLLFDGKLHRQRHSDRLELAIWRPIDSANRGEILNFQPRPPATARLTRAAGWRNATSARGAPPGAVAGAERPKARPGARLGDPSNLIQLMTGVGRVYVASFQDVATQRDSPRCGLRSSAPASRG